MKILLTAATPFEIAPVAQWLEQQTGTSGTGSFAYRNLVVQFLPTGVGMVNTAWQLGQWFARELPGLALNAGVAGAFDRSLALGDVVHVTQEVMGDLGVEESDGRFTDLFQLGLVDRNDPPFVQGRLYNLEAQDMHFLPAVSGLTVNRVHGHAPSIEAIRSRYPDVQVETMEGAAFFQACLLAGVPFLAVRAVSNYVEPRNREGWQLEAAIDNLNRVLIDMIRAFAGEQS